MNLATSHPTRSGLKGLLQGYSVSAKPASAKATGHAAPLSVNTEYHHQGSYKPYPFESDSRGQNLINLMKAESDLLIVLDDATLNYRNSLSSSFSYRKEIVPSCWKKNHSFLTNVPLIYLIQAVCTSLGISPKTSYFMGSWCVHTLECFSYTCQCGSRYTHVHESAFWGANIHVQHLHRNVYICSHVLHGQSAHSLPRKEPPSITQTSNTTTQGRLLTG